MQPLLHSGTVITSGTASNTVVLITVLQFVLLLSIGFTGIHTLKHHGDVATPKAFMGEVLPIFKAGSNFKDAS